MATALTSSGHPAPPVWQRVFWACAEGVIAAVLLGVAGLRALVLESEDKARAPELCSGRREPIDLILTDVVMPVLDGLQLAEQAKSHHPEARILFMSGYTRAELPPGGRLLSKPFGRDDLLSTVRSSLGA